MYRHRHNHGWCIIDLREQRLPVKIRKSSALYIINIRNCSFECICICSSSVFVFAFQIYLCLYSKSWVMHYWAERAKAPCKDKKQFSTQLIHLNRIFLIVHSNIFVFVYKMFLYLYFNLYSKLINKYKWDGMGNPHWEGLGEVCITLRPCGAKNGKYIWDLYFRVIKGQRMAKSRSGVGDSQVFMLVSVVQGKTQRQTLLNTNKNTNSNGLVQEITKCECLWVILSEKN